MFASARRKLVGVAAILWIGVWSLNAQGENWPQWRGAKLDGISNETNLPTKWSPTENVAWKTELPGPAGATPVVWGDRIFLTSANESALELLCLNTEGKILWKKVISNSNQAVRDDEGNFASPSPSTDGERVVVFMGDGTLACFDFEGKELWKFNVQDRYGKLNIQFGMASTPILDGDRIYMQLIHGDGDIKTREATVVALDKKTGVEVWRAARPSDGKAECEHSYASPMLYRDDKQEFLITHGADYVVAHNLKDGSELWRCGGFNPKGNYNPTLRFVASPVAVPGLIVVPSAKNGPVTAIKPGGAGDITTSDFIAWVMPKNTPDVPSPLVKDGLVYLCRENGNLICLEADTGKEVYEQRTVRDRHRASPVFADGKLYLTSRNGPITVIKAGRDFDVLSTNDLGEPQTASPVISNGTIYLRTFKALYAIRQKQ